MIISNYFGRALPNNDVPERPRCPTRGRNGFRMRRFNRTFPPIRSAPGITNWPSSVAYFIRGMGVSERPWHISTRQKSRNIFLSF